MPAIRAYTWTYEAVTTDGGLTIPMCNSQSGDLLIVLAMGDTGAPTWGCSNGSGTWTQFFARNNTCSAVGYWKIAGASEADIAITASVSETYNGCVIAIRDVDQTNPFGNPSIINHTTQAAAGKFAMSQITTNVNDAIVLYASFCSGANVPSFIEGPIAGLIGADGAAESMGVGWSMQRTAGLTPTINCANTATGAIGVKLTLQIAPPSAGAGIIPAYCASDSSVLLDIINGNGAFNGNTALAATADTNFGTNLGGITANDGTVAASSDVGINSFHSFGRITSAAAAGTMSGAELVFAVANRPNATGKNILCHVRPQTPGNYQRLAPVSSGRGVWFGVRSAAANYKIWLVHGVGTDWPLDATLPIVINPSAANVKASAGTLDAAAVQAIGFWVGAIGALTTAMEFGVAWMMDNCVIAGGVTSEPVNLSGIVKAAALGHERLSMVQQGSGQAICLQAIQLGDGGTNKLVLDLDATAIEFPKQYDGQKNVNYNSVDNAVGLTYYAGSTDTIKHRNSVISSASKYHWRIHASSSAAAIYDFSGLSLIGAGDVQLRQVTTFAGMAFTNCLAIVQNGAVVSGCTFSNSKITASNPANISACKFTSGGTGHAIEITTAGTYTFTGNTFTGYGVGGTTDAAIYNNSGGSVTLNITGGGSTPTIRNGVGASTTVNNSVNLTLNGLVTGSDIVILQSGTETLLAQVDAHGSGSYVYSYSVQQLVDIAVYKTGQIPFFIRNYSLGATDSTLPIAQVTDPSYLE